LKAFGISYIKKPADNIPFNENQLDQLLSSKHDKSTIENFGKEKINGAIRTDFILSAEITVIFLDVVSQRSL
jgi:predicted DNA repair protein MutK